MLLYIKYDLNKEKHFTCSLRNWHEYFRPCWNDSSYTAWKKNYTELASTVGGNILWTEVIFW